MIFQQSAPQEVYDDLDHEADENYPEDSTTSKEVPKLVKLYIFFLLTFQSTFQISDAAISVLLAFISTFLGIVARNYNVDAALLLLFKQLPVSIKAARKLIDGNRDNFEKYVCCPSCFSTYPWKHDTSKSCQKLCTHIEFPNHPQHWNRKACGRQLMKSVKTPKQASLFYPRLVYCYKPVLQTLQEFLLRPKFFTKCEIWRERSTVDGEYNDVYDGNIWREFLDYKGKPFLSLPFNFAFSLNVDWFQPFKHTQHAEAVYLTILNLPRQERYLQENVILLGVIPGPKEPSLHINTLLEPLVKEMMSLWTGVVMNIAQGVQTLVRGALLCCGCDVPAARKVCSFLAHNAYRGCSRCLLPFPTITFGEKADYTNTDRSQWPPRAIESHKQHALAYKCCNTQAAREELERRYGMVYITQYSMSYLISILPVCALSIPCTTFLELPST